MSTKSRNQERGKRQKKSYRRNSGRFAKPAYPTPPCAICQEPIKNITNALAQPIDNAPVHFDCALKEVKARMQPSKGELVIYLGKGSFALVDAKAYQSRRLKIINRLDWELQDSDINWRKDLAKSFK